MINQVKCIFYTSVYLINLANFSTFINFIMLQYYNAQRNYRTYYANIIIRKTTHDVYNYIVSSADVSNNWVVLLKWYHGDVVP